MAGYKKSLNLKLQMPQTNTTTTITYDYDSHTWERVWEIYAEGKE